MTNTTGSTLRDRLDRFWGALFLNEHGRPKSAMFLYSFCLSLLFFALYAASYGLLIDVLEKAFAGASVPVRNAAESVLPGLAATIVCCSMFFLFPDRRLVPAAYIWLAVYALGALVTTAFLTPKEEFRIFLYFFAMLVPAGLVSGGTVSFLLYRRCRRRQEKENAPC